MVAVVGVVVGVVLVHAVRFNVGAVKTTRVTPVDAVDPALGAAVNVPL